MSDIEDSVPFRELRQALSREQERRQELEAELEAAKRPSELRDFAERVQQRNSELESLPGEISNLKRQLGLARAGVNPDSLLAQTVDAAAAAEGVDDPDQVANLARALGAELNGGH